MAHRVILVDSRDVTIGTAEKLLAHRAGLLHRAFSVFVFNPSGALLLQRRARSKYHSPGLWSNTCCSHPAPGEDVLVAAHRRLREEMGLDCPLEFVFSFLYRACLGDSMCEHECDHVFVGRASRDPTPDTMEVDRFRWVDLPRLEQEVRRRPDRYTIWFRIALRELESRRLRVGPVSVVAPRVNSTLAGSLRFRATSNGKPPLRSSDNVCCLGGNTTPWP